MDGLAWRTVWREAVSCLNGWNANAASFGHAPVQSDSSHHISAICRQMPSIISTSKKHQGRGLETRAGESDRKTVRQKEKKTFLYYYQTSWLLLQPIPIILTNYMNFYICFRMLLFIINKKNYIILILYIKF